MTNKVVLTMYLLPLFLFTGCQEKQKPASLINELKQKQQKELEYSIAGTCEGCDARWPLEVTTRDLVIARNPGIDNQILYLIVVDKEGDSVNCCGEPMRIVVKNSGKLVLYCRHCGEFKPIAVKGGKVVVEKDNK